MPNSERVSHFFYRKDVDLTLKNKNDKPRNRDNRTDGTTVPGGAVSWWGPIGWRGKWYTVLKKDCLTRPSLETSTFYSINITIRIEPHTFINREGSTSQDDESNTPSRWLIRKSLCPDQTVLPTRAKSSHVSNFVRVWPVLGVPFGQGPMAHESPQEFKPGPGFSKND